MSAILTPRQNAYLSKKTAQKKEQITKILCLDSFIEAARNLDYNFVKSINAKVLFENHFLNKHKASYISSESFFENKHGFPEHNLSKEAIPTLFIDNKQKSHFVSTNFYQKFLQGFHNDNKFIFDVQVRGFKTDRSSKAEKYRNPTLLTRLKNSLGFSSASDTDFKSQPEIPNNSDRLKQILTAEEVNISDGEKQRIKVAFAEGYLIGNTTTTNQGKTAKYLKIIQQVLTIVIFLAIVVSLMASASGSVFR